MSGKVGRWLYRSYTFYLYTFPPSYLYTFPPLSIAQKLQNIGTTKTVTVKQIRFNGRPTLVKSRNL